MEKAYVLPKVEIVKFDTEDICTMSGVEKGKLAFSGAQNDSYMYSEIIKDPVIITPSGE